MPSVNLRDLDVEKLSDETLNLISKLTTEITRLSGKTFRFNDPFLLPKIRRRVKRLKEPSLTKLYYDYKKALLSSVKESRGKVVIKGKKRTMRDFSQLRRIPKKARPEKPATIVRIST